MSFNFNVKEDLIQNFSDNEKSNKLELEAILRLSSEIVFSRPMKLEVTLSTMGIMRHFLALCKKYYKIETEVASRVINRFDNRTTFTCSINNGAEEIIKDLNLFGSSSEYRKNELKEDEGICYLKGAFLARGSVNDPMAKNSHFEISTTNEAEILFLQKLLNDFDLNARISKRKNMLIVYIKAKDSIGEILYRLGASSSMSYYEDTVITKEIRATAHRAVNLDLANQDKTLKAAIEQLEIIEYLEYNYPLEKLDPKLLMVMKVRKDYKDHSLNQLLEIIHEKYDPSLTKSGLNHRFRKLKELYLELKKSKGEL